MEIVEPISRVEAIELRNDEHVDGSSKKNKKRDWSTKRSHSSSRRHRHIQGSYSQSLLDSIFDATTRFSEFIQTNLDESSYNMLKAFDAPSLADSVIELSSRTLLIGKMMKEKSTSGISSTDFERMKTKIDESNGKLKSLTAQIK